MEQNKQQAKNWGSPNDLEKEAWKIEREAIGEQVYVCYLRMLSETHLTLTYDFLEKVIEVFDHFADGFSSQLADVSDNLPKKWELVDSWLTHANNERVEAKIIYKMIGAKAFQACMTVLKRTNEADCTFTFDYESFIAIKATFKNRTSELFKKLNLTK